VRQKLKQVFELTKKDFSGEGDGLAKSHCTIWKWM